MRLSCAEVLGSALLVLTISAASSSSPHERIQFTDIAKTAGIRFTHYKGSHGVSTILEEAGPGVCVADFDGNGFEDIYFVNGRDLYGDGIEVQNALYRNNGNGTFTDVTESAGVPGNAYGLGCIWGDYDNDGHPDLYVTQYGKNILYRNSGDGTFTDVTQKAHVDGADFGTVFHTGATFFDYDLLTYKSGIFSRNSGVTFATNETRLLELIKSNSGIRKKDFEEKAADAGVPREEARRFLDKNVLSGSIERTGSKNKGYKHYWKGVQDQDLLYEAS